MLIKDLAKVNLITGSNGSGKTNLIDGVYYTCFGRSYFSSNDRKVLKWDSDFFRINSVVNKHDRSYELITKVIPGKLKEIEINGKKLHRISELIGLFPIIAIAPKEIYTLLLTSESRRKLMDQVISQSDKSYLNNLLNYNAYLSRRNALLKEAGSISRLDLSLIDAIDQKLSQLGSAIFNKRKVVTDGIMETFEEIYGLISKEQEFCSFKYSSQLRGEELSILLKSSLEKDAVMQRTTVGIHKDDLKFYINGEALNAYGSQGQLKSFIISLKLALFRSLANQGDLTWPILLLDDIFDKFDENRTAALMTYILSEKVGQVFITDANDTRMKSILTSIDESLKHIRVSKGEIIDG